MPELGQEGDRQQLENIKLEIYEIQRHFERNSPSIVIQSLYRGYKDRVYAKKYRKHRTRNAIIVQRYIRKWLALGPDERLRRK